MLNTIYLIAIILGVSGQNISKKPFTQKAAEKAFFLRLPLISAGGILVTFLVALAFYKEKFTKIQLIGYLCGVLSVVFLNL